MRPTVRWSLLVALVACCLAAPATAAAPEVKDEAKFFSADVVTKANTALKEIKEQTARDLLIETFPEIPEGRKKDYTAEKKDEFFSKWASDNARERKLVGVYVLICKDPARVQVEVSKDTLQRSFTAADRMKLRELLINNFKAKKFDEGLSEAVAYVAKTLKANIEVKDEGGFFSAEALKKAIQEIVGIQQRYGKELVVETVKEIPADLKKDYTPAKRQEFFYKWARDRARAGKVNGVYVLICKDPSHLQVEVGNETQKKAFTIKDRDKMAQILLTKFREKKFDEGLSEAVKFFETTLKSNLGEKGS
jgi:uncharacterized membrane protein YgcG